VYKIFFLHVPQIVTQKGSFKPQYAPPLNDLQHRPTQAKPASDESCYRFVVAAPLSRGSTQIAR